MHTTSSLDYSLTFQNFRLLNWLNSPSIAQVHFISIDTDWTHWTLKFYLIKESMRCGDAKCVGWKDLFPPVLKLVSDYPKLMVNGIVTTGAQYRQQCINTLVMMKWQLQILTPIAMMFRYEKKIKFSWKTRFWYRKVQENWNVEQWRILERLWLFV